MIKCGREGSSQTYATIGWSDPEKDFTWTSGKRAELLFRTAPTTRLLRLRMRLGGNIKPPEVPVQPIEVSANGQKVADWQVGDSADFTAEFPGEIIKAGGELRIGFKIPAAASPKQLGISADPRVLGLCCWEYEITEV